MVNSQLYQRLKKEKESVQFFILVLVIFELMSCFTCWAHRNTNIMEAAVRNGCFDGDLVDMAFISF